MSELLPKEIPALCIVSMGEGRGYPNCMAEILAEVKPIIERQERERIYYWLSIEWKDIDDKTVTYYRSKVDEFFSKP